MKQIFVSAAFAMAFAAIAVGCAGETSGPSETGSVNVNLIVGNTDVTSVAFEVECDSGITLNGNFNVVDDRDPPVWATIMDLPVGICTVTLIAQDSAGATLCTASENVEVLENQTVKVNLVLACTIDAEEALGNIDIDATFEIIDGNLCPRLHFLNAVPIDVPTSGSEVTVLVSDGDNDPLTTALTATGGSFADPTAQLTTYVCDGAAGGQTIFVTVSDGDTACDKSKSFDVVCPGVDPCEGVVCEDDGNVCTDAECVDGECVTSNNTNECTAGGGGELAVNGGFETGDLSGWTLFCDAAAASCEATMEEAEAGLWSGKVSVQGTADSVIKNANIGIGTVQPNSACDVSFDLLAPVVNTGGVVFVEFFSELTGGGTSSAVILLGPVTEPINTWTSYSFNTPTGPDVSGGVTVQLKSGCGAVAGCAVDAYFDNVSVNCGGSGGGAGTCQEGVCEPNPECSVPADCPDTGNECIDPVCDAGTCGTSNNTNACDGGAGTCDGAGVCVPNAECAVPGDCTDDGNECTDPVCNAGVCETSNNTNACDGGAGTCNAGVCEPNAEVFYDQNFNLLPLDPGGVIGDGWLYFINVFADGGAVYRFGFGGDAPQGPQISDLVTTEGGPEQEPQQLVVFSQYDGWAADIGHNNPTDLVETNVFQERTIGAADVGKTFTFVFQAKGGNLGGSTTANGFIKTLRPPSFGESAVDRADTTGLPDTWGGFTVSITIPDNTFIGDILQFGFQTNASNFEPSGNFYDNVLVTTE